MTDPVVARTGRVTPAPGGPHVEQVGWGVARQVARAMTPLLGEPAPELLDDVVRLAEAPGFLAYAVLAGRDALAVALVSLPGDPGDDPAAVAAYVGDVVVPGASTVTREALLVRALHDVAAAGVGWLRVEVPHVDLRPFGFC